MPIRLAPVVNFEIISAPSEETCALTFRYLRTLSDTEPATTPTLGLDLPSLRTLISGLQTAQQTIENARPGAKPHRSS